MSKLKDSDSALPFEDLIIELYNIKQDKESILAYKEFILKRKKDYALVHLYTLLACCNSYYNSCLLKSINQ